MRSVDGGDVARAVQLLERAARVFVTGARSSYSVAWLLGLLLSQVRPGVVSLSSADPVPVDVSDVGASDALLAISLPRYTTTTLRVARYFRQRGAKLVLITDSLRSPLAGDADVALTVPHASVSFFNSNVAATALANALIVAMVSRRPDRIRRRLRQWEDVWRHFNTHAIQQAPRGRRSTHEPSSSPDR
jgi:DNA-binding MurR/RpiR family transcriptional regulator